MASKRKTVKPAARFAAMPNARINHTQAAVVGAELERIRAERGCVKPSVVVEEAKAANALLHPFFTWDNRMAAQKCREEEARLLIRSVRVVYADNVPLAEQPIIRAYVNVAASDKETRFSGNAYIPITEAAEDESYKSQVLDRAKEELRLWQTKYSDLKDYFERVFEAIEVEA